MALDNEDTFLKELLDVVPLWETMNPPKWANMQTPRDNANLVNIMGSLIAVCGKAREGYLSMRLAERMPELELLKQGMRGKDYPAALADAKRIHGIVISCVLDYASVRYQASIDAGEGSNS